jgi:glyoxylase-like metal-dependent hydrolase (beta-lactamase superfamily II)
MIAKPCSVSGFDDPDFPREIEVIDLSGHAPGQVGYKLPDGSVFLADVLCTKQTLDKYAIVYLYDVAAHLESLERVAQMQIPEGAMFIPAHCPAAEDVAELTAYNKEKILEIADFLTEACKEPKTLEQLLAEAFEHYGLTMNFAQHALIGSTIRSYLTYLEAAGQIEILIENYYLYYRAK